MSIPERIFKIGKAYIGQVRDRIDAELAEKELEAAEYDAAHPYAEDSSPEGMMRRAEARIASARQELEERNRRAQASQNGESVAEVAATTATSTPPVSAAPQAKTPAAADPNAADFTMLGVAVGSDFPVVQAAYEDLSRRCDPNRFTNNPAEQKQAEAILDKVNKAYEALRDRLDPMQNRFRKLELE